jgi:plastocyanin
MENRSRMHSGTAGTLTLALGLLFGQALPPASTAVAADAVDLNAPAPNASGPNASGDIGRLTADVNRLKQELRDQRQLILQLMQMDQQRYDVLLRYLQSGGAPGNVGASGIPGLPAPPALPGGVAGASAGGPSAPGAREATAAPASHESSSISGHVRVSGGAPGELYVYLDGPRAAPVRNRTVEIKQKDKQFTPRVAVVALGTRMIFPNVDTVIHNVFSTSPGNAFDLGSVKSGDRTAPVALLRPGHVEIFCNIHSKMRADVLVVPNAHWARVNADGSFQVSNVPTGMRRVVVWGPNIKPASQDVEVTGKGASVTFAAEPAGGRPHMNKRGQAYGSYDE